MKKASLFLSILLLLSSLALAEGEEYKLDLSEIEKKPYHLGGYGELRPVLSGLDRDAAFYKLRFFDRDEGRTIADLNSRLLLDGSYEEGMARFFARMNADLSHTYLGWSDEVKLYEGYLSLKPSSSLSIDLGKKTLKWGKGYAFNPVSFIDRPKDPNEPELALEGFWVASMDYIRSFSGPLKTISFTPVLLPVARQINEEFGSSNQVNMAAKLYLLLYDTDIDFIVFTGGSRTTRYGIDFSRNITTNFEIHGELAYVEDFKKRTVDSAGRVSTSDTDAVSFLLGVRYLTARDTTYIVEYYRNGMGFERDEMEVFFSFIDTGYTAYLSSRNSSPLSRASSLAEGNYGRPNPMKDYLYFRVIQKEPFDILYFSPALTVIGNLQDLSFSAAPEFSYTRITNLELRLRTLFPVGKRGTDFGERQYDYRIELRVRYYF